jgi:hypothetical protein
MRIRQTDTLTSRKTSLNSIVRRTLSASHPGWRMVLLGLSLFGRPALADDGIEYFEKKVRPVLIRHCYKCHSAAASEVKGGLRLDSRNGIRQGGDSGPAVVPGKIDESLLIDAVKHESLEMPPNKKLPDAVIEDLQRWIKMGAPDPRDHPPTSSEAAGLSWEATLAERRNWWSLQPVSAPDIPNPKETDWSDQAIDRFVRTKLEDAALMPAEPAASRALIRRLSLVLLGLPPEPDEVKQFVTEYSAQPEVAYASLVHRLLDSPHFGECWARHWMDVVRFTETHGNEWNYEVHHAWRYRDYLIRALNQDVPYDQLVREHIAGDLLDPPRWNDAEQFNESVIGTAFYRFGEVNHDDCIDLRKIGFDIVDNQIDTLSKAFQATTVACARCHDHKIDSVSMKDYYALLGILRSSRQVAHTIDSPTRNAKPMQRLHALKSQIREVLAEQWRQDVSNAGRYLLAAEATRRDQSDATNLAAGLDPERLKNWVAAIKIEEPSVDDPLAPWRSLVASATGGEPEGLANAWQQLGTHYVSEQRTREKFNDESFLSFGDFRHGDRGDWQVSGQGLRDGMTKSGEFCVAHEGDRVVNAILPAGSFTHTLSEKLNGALRSPALLVRRKHISFRMLGEHSSAVRLVSNNCQLNYKNYRAVASDAFRWVTFSPPEDLEHVRVYAELMTKFDNPKFPDQLYSLGNDPFDGRIPWEEAAADPRSYFGVTQVVLHDCKETPKEDLSHLCALFEQAESAEPQTMADAAGRYATVIEGAIQTWSEQRATDADTRWLRWMLQHDLLENSLLRMPRLAELIAEYRTVETNELARPRVVPGMVDFGPGFDQALLVAGDCLQPGDMVPRRYPGMPTHSAARPHSTGSGRLEMAEWMVSPDNPLTARVMVNRIWHHLFGTGIVKSVDDFGRVGELPSHPQLLDHLAARFVDENWSIKSLIREIVLTRTFRMSSSEEHRAKQVDPLNKLLHHYPARRLGAEAIRDSILATSGRLDRTMFGLSIRPYREVANTDRRLFPGSLTGKGRRSVYIKMRLMESPKFLNAFDFPGGKVTQGRRHVTNGPTQALAMLNDPFVIEQAGVWADRLVDGTHDSISSRIHEMILQALGRPPVADEREEFEDLVRQLSELYQVRPESILRERTIWKDIAHAIFNLKEFIYIP